MGVMLDKIQFILVLITFNELMWLYNQLHTQHTHTHNNENTGLKLFHYICAFDACGMHFIMCLISKCLYEAFLH